MAEWREVNAAEFATALRKMRERDHVTTEAINGTVRVWFRGYGDYRDSQWIAKTERIGKDTYYYVAENAI